MIAYRVRLAALGLFFATVGGIGAGCGSSPSANPPPLLPDDTAPTSTSTEGDAAPVPSVPSPVPTGTSWAKESIHPFTWTEPKDLPGMNGVVRIEESVDGKAWTEVESVDISAFYYRWKVPAVGSTARMRIVFMGAGPDGAEVGLRAIETPPITLLPSAKRSYTWKKMVSNAPFGARDGAGGITYNGKMWLIGGWNAGTFPLINANDVWSSVDGATWIREKPNTYLDAATFDKTKDWEGRHWGGYHVFDNKMWIVGGDITQGYYQTDIWSSTDGVSWTRRDRHETVYRMIRDNNPGSPTYGQMVRYPGYPPIDIADFGRRTLYVSGVFGNKMWVMGGQVIQQFVDPEWPGLPAKSLDDVWVSSNGGEYTAVPTKGAHWSPRGIVGELVDFGGKMWMVGGGLYDDPVGGIPKPVFSNEVWNTTDGASWAKVEAAAPWSPRYYHNVKVYDDRLWVINGYDGAEGGQGRFADNIPDVWYTADGTNWYEASPPPEFVPRHAGTAWVHQNALFVGSGNAIGASETDASASEWFADVWKMSKQ